MNQKEIAAIECVNKSRPEMQCNGKCYLAKQLQKAEDNLNAKKEKNNQSFSHLKVIEGSLFIPNEIVSFQLNSSFILKAKSIYNYNQCYDLLSCEVIFHPPSAIFNV
ncbi:MAG: hypothetical protein EBQ94_00800 [Flavobacteriales bacterium]|nr:hypothetical protein [Flavobacteriales bacterium]NCA21473.1 hypothetical protein [Crocinitomicaceae bacterium]